MNYQTIIRAAQRTPWAILPDKLVEIRTLLALKSEGGDVDPQKVAGLLNPKQGRTLLQKVGSVAVISVFGSIIHRAGGIREGSGTVSAERIQAAVKNAVEDSVVESIVLDIDSPGGSVNGIQETFNVLFEARGSKPIVAVANCMAASAAYHLAAGAHEIVVAPSGEVGSIGVFAIHEDFSEFDKMAGVKTTLISAGEFKTEFNPWEPLSDEARQEVQRSVDESHAQFIADVAKGRGVDRAKVRKEFGRGRMVEAKRAVRLGMADRVATLDETVNRLTGRGRHRVGKKRVEEMTVREFEETLVELGCTKAQAKKIAAEGFGAELRDVTVPTEDVESRDVTAPDVYRQAAELLKALSQ